MPVGGRRKSRRDAESPRAPRTRSPLRGPAAALLALAVLACAPANAVGATFTVASTSDQTDSQPGDGLCASLAFSCTLRAAIQEANSLPGADTISLPAGTYELGIPPLNQNDVSTGDLDITEALTLTGAGAGSTIVDGGAPKPGSPPEVRGLDRLFEVEAPSGTVTFSMLAIRDGYAADYGGGVLNGGNATVNLTNASLTGNFAGKTGGGIDNHAGGTVQVTGSDISGNAANEAGSALNNNRDGTLTVVNSTVSKNSAAAVGGDATLSGAGAIANNAELDTRGIVSIAGSSIFENAAGGTNSGAAVSNDGAGTVEVRNTRIYKNDSQSEGGAIYNDGGGLTVAGSVLDENVADDGGAIYNGDRGAQAVVESSTFSTNRARAGGGAISSGGLGELRVSGSTFTKNSAADWGGAVLNDDKGSATIVNSSFSENSGLSGGGFANEGTGLVTVESSTFAKNSAPTGEGGGLHTNSVGEVSVTGGSFTENRAQDGGGLSNEGGGKVTVSGTRFSTNTAEGEGGGVLVDSGNVRLVGVEVTGNVAKGPTAGGGGVSFQGDQAVSVGESAAIQDSRILANQASSSGGGIDSRGDGELTVTTTTIASNTATTGGGLSHDGDAALQVTRSTLSQNQAKGGGGLFTDGDGEATLENTTVSTNTASEAGGGLLVSSRLTSRSTTVTGNSAPSGGGINNGALSDGGGFVFLRNTIVAGNSTGGNCAGPITSLGGNLDGVDTCRFRELTDQPATDPRLGPLADNGGPTLTHALTAGSPAQDKAIEPCTATDQRGVARPQGAGCDVGAYESELAPSPPVDPVCAGRSERTVLAEADSWISQGAPGSNFGNDATLKLKSQSTSNSRALVRFGLPAPPPGCKLVGATLRLHASSATENRTLEAVRAGSSWSETGVTWSNQPQTTGAVTTTGSGLDYREWNVTAQTQAMYEGANYGFLIRDAAENGAGSEQGLHSREKGTDRPPELVLVFDSELPPDPPPSGCSESRQTASAAADSWISQSSASKNFGKDSILKVKSQNRANSRALLRFALPPVPPGCSMTEAKLRLYAASFKSGRTLQASQIAGAWTETGVTWSNQPQTTGAAAEAPSAFGYVEWTVTSQVQAMYAGTNNGFLVRDRTESGVGPEQGFHSREKGTDRPPELVVTYE